MVKAINHWISFHCQVYTQCQSWLILLGADMSTLNQFQKLKKQDIKTSTAILMPNESGSMTLTLSWIWHDIMQHVLPWANVDVSGNPGAMFGCISFHCSTDTCTHIVSVRHVHWLCAQAQQHCWQEECMLVTYEMEWTVHYFHHKSHLCISALTDDFSHIGSSVYAQWKATMWDHLAHDANHLFTNINTHYKSPL